MLPDCLSGDVGSSPSWTAKKCCKIPPGANCVGEYANESSMGWRVGRVAEAVCEPTGNQREWSNQHLALYGAVAQLVEHGTEDPGVGSSTLPRPTANWPK